MKIGYQGIKASNSEEASYIFARSLQMNDVEYVPLVNSSNVVNSLLNKEIDLGVMAISNIVAGEVKETSEALKNADLEKISEVKIYIHHCLFKKKNVKLQDINTIASHIQALGQTKNNIERLFSNCQKQEVEDTALAAKMLANNEIADNVAVICRKNAGELYNLDLVYENIEDDSKNITLFGLYKLKS